MGERRAAGNLIVLFGVSVEGVDDPAVVVDVELGAFLFLRLQKRRLRLPGQID